jgi:SP family sugar:H+ symporter-like MFS transporter
MKGFSIEQLDFLYDNAVPTMKFKGYRFDSETAVVLEGESTSVKENDMPGKGPMVAAKNISESDLE